MTSNDNFKDSAYGLRYSSSLKVRRCAVHGDVDNVRTRFDAQNTFPFATTARKVASADCITGKEREGPPLPLPSQSLLLPLSLSPVILVVGRRSCCSIGGGDAVDGFASYTDQSQRIHRSSGDIGVSVGNGKSKVRMEELGSIGGVMQGQPQQMSGGQVRYLQSIMDRTSDLQRRIDLLESRMPDWNWVEECETEKWTSWWRHTVWRVTALILYNFILCLVSGVLSIYWHLMRSLFVYRVDKGGPNERTSIALLVLFVKIISWYCGRKVHTGRLLTWAIIIIDGLTTAFVYNAGMYSIRVEPDAEIIYPLLIAAPQILVYSAILQHIGIRLTLRSRKLGVKRLPFVLAVLQAIILLLFFSLNAGKGGLEENRDLFLHGLSGTISGMLITLGMACYIVSCLQNKLVSENVREVISMYSLARRADLPSDFMMMPPCELDPGGVV